MMMVQTSCHKQCRRGVICIHCGSPTPISQSHFGVSLLRCRLCNKEAPYGEADIIDLPAALAAVNGS